MGHVFDPDKLHAIARKAVGLPHDEMVRAIIDEMKREWPKHVEIKQDWIFSLAAGATGIMNVVHGSLTEYVVIFGSPIGTEGFSGRYFLDIYDVVLAGEMWTYTEESFAEKVVYKPGDMALLPKGQVKGFRFPEGGWLLEYGRGLVPTSLPVALGDSIFSAMDLKTLFKSLKIYGSLVTRELLQGKI
jgi:C-8 sterol isomerase